MRVSIIIPCYNHAHYLPNAVQTVLAQSFFDWEALIVDDGSTDNTKEVAAKFIDPRIHYIFQKNQGLSAARNTGIRAAHGEYLAFLDADDEWSPRFLERCLDEFADCGSATAVVTLTRFIDENGATLPRIGGQAIPSSQFRTRLLEGGFFPVHAVLVKAEVVRRVGMFDEILTSVEDWDLWLRIQNDGGTMVSIPEPLARYRISANSMSTNAQRMHDNRMLVLTKLFGPSEGDPALWSEEKQRAYAFAYRTTALGYLQQQNCDIAWHMLNKAAQFWPPILTQLDTYYEIVCGRQPKGIRGQTKSLEIDQEGKVVLQQLAALFANATPALQNLRGAAYGNAYLTLAMLSDQAGRWGAARKYMRQALQSYPALLRNRSVARRMLKLLVGQHVVRGLRPLQLETTSSTLE